MSVQNMEEAASIAAEYVSSLENLPNEVQFLLTEIRNKDARTQELQQEIQKESSKYIRHALRSPGQPLGPKDQPIPEKVQEDYAEIARLGEEKVKLAQRVVYLVNRARARLDHDLARMLVLQGELDPSQQAAYASGALNGRNAAQSITDSLRQALAPQEPVFSTPTVPQAAAPANKKRKVDRTTKQPSPAPTALRGRLTQVRQSPVRGRRNAAAAAAAEVMSVGDEDAEGEEDVEEGAEEAETEDQSLYCFCQRQSYGEMIGCDNETCQYQWFHLDCVNLSAPLPENWYCSDCIAKGFSAVTVTVEKERPRKGRKK